jgi:hypothetical protein
LHLSEQAPGKLLNMPEPIPMFISYAHKDEPFLNELSTFLKPLQRNNTINIWTDKKIVAGQQWNELIKKQLASSKIILFLVSPDFLASDYIHNTEINDAVTNRHMKAVVVISIIIRPITMELLPLNESQVIPTGARAVSDWESRDKAWNDVLKALMNVFSGLSSDETKRGENTAEESVTSELIAIHKKPVSSMIVSWLFVVLIAACIVLFMLGVVNRDLFFCSASLAGIAAGILGYFISKKLSIS